MKNVGMLSLLFILNTSFLSALGPDFLIVGAPKSGTSSLYNYICQHPLVQRACEKEIRYYSKYQYKGLNWYLAQFPKKLSNKHLVGEATPEYMYGIGCARRIKKDFPNAKLIMILRNPVDRAYSAYQHARRERWSVIMNGRGAVKEFKDCISERSNLIKRGMYSQYIVRWLRLFRREQMLFIDFQDLVDNPGQEMQRVYAFLDLPPFQEVDFGIRNSGGSYEKLHPLIRKKLSTIFAPGNAELERLLGMHFDW